MIQITSFKCPECNQPLKAEPDSEGFLVWCSNGPCVPSTDLVATGETVEQAAEKLIGMIEKEME